MTAPLSLCVTSPPIIRLMTCGATGAQTCASGSCTASRKGSTKRTEKSFPSQARQEDGSSRVFVRIRQLPRFLAPVAVREHEGVVPAVPFDDVRRVGISDPRCPVGGVGIGQRRHDRRASTVVGRQERPAAIVGYKACHRVQKAGGILARRALAGCPLAAQFRVGQRVDGFSILVYRRPLIQLRSSNCARTGERCASWITEQFRLTVSRVGPI